VAPGKEVRSRVLALALAGFDPTALQQWILASALRRATNGIVADIAVPSREVPRVGRTPHFAGRPPHSSCRRRRNSKTGYGSIPHTADAYLTADRQLGWVPSASFISHLEGTFAGDRANPRRTITRSAPRDELGRVASRATSRAKCPLKVCTILVESYPEALQAKNRHGLLPFQIAAANDLALDVVFYLVKKWTAGASTRGGEAPDADDVEDSSGKKRKRDV
jgi:hypothetical protein